MALQRCMVSPNMRKQEFKIEGCITWAKFTKRVDNYLKLEAWKKFLCKKQIQRFGLRFGFSFFPALLPGCLQNTRNEEVFSFCMPRRPFILLIKGQLSAPILKRIQATLSKDLNVRSDMQWFCFAVIHDTHKKPSQKRQQDCSLCNPQGRASASSPEITNRDGIWTPLI